MSYTTTQLADAVLRELSVVDATETPETDHRTRVIEAYQQLWEEMAAHGRDLIYWPYDVIPAAVFLIMRDWVALLVGNYFGSHTSPAEKEQLRMLIERRLRTHTQTLSAKRPVQAVYF